MMRKAWLWWGVSSPRGPSSLRHSCLRDSTIAKGKVQLLQTPLNTSMPLKSQERARPAPTPRADTRQQRAWLELRAARPSQSPARGRPSGAACRARGAQGGAVGKNGETTI